jgi:protein-tyrosine phosphatase
VIDIHAHIIPDLDDGPPDMESSVEMGVLMEREGISAVISTSHSAEASQVGHAGMRSRLEEVGVAWREAEIDISLELGIEIYLRPDTVDDLNAGRLWTMAASRYVLVEVPYQPWPTYADNALFALQLAGYVPILAHPERYTIVQADLHKMYELAERGVLAQVTAAALLGEHGVAPKKCAEMLLRHNLVQFIATDAHSAHWRSPMMRRALMLAEEMVGRENVGMMAQTHPARILANQEIIPEPVEPVRRKGFFDSLFGR